MPRRIATSSAFKRVAVENRQAFADRILFMLGMDRSKLGKSHCYIIRTNDGGLHLYPTKPDGLVQIDLEEAKQNPVTRDTPVKPLRAGDVAGEVKYREVLRDLETLRKKWR